MNMTEFGKKCIAQVSLLGGLGWSRNFWGLALYKGYIGITEKKMEAVFRVEGIEYKV